MKVNNASDLYCEKYITKMAQLRQDDSLHAKISTLSDYYHANFQRLMVVGFLPYYCADYESMKNTFLNFNRFTPEDISRFIKPFIAILDNESAFYFDYWQSVHNATETLRRGVEARFAAEVSKYSRVFEHYNKAAAVLFSYSITRNGRGIFDNNNFSALVPFPENDGEFSRAFFMALHEFTHQLTDALLQTHINMDDGSHDLSEWVVILADYYLIEAVDKARLGAYLEWLRSFGMTATKANFFELFDVGEELHRALRNVVDKILGD